MTTTATLDYRPAKTEFGSDNDDGLHCGGWINVDVDIVRDGATIATAHVGAWVWTAHALGGATADVADECHRDGYAFRRYRGGERHLIMHVDVDLTDLTGSDDVDEAEAALLDAAYDRAQFDLEEIYAEALRARLSNTSRDSTYRLIDAVAALEQ